MQIRQEVKIKLAKHPLHCKNVAYNNYLDSFFINLFKFLLALNSFPMSAAYALDISAMNDDHWTNDKKKKPQKKNMHTTASSKTYTVRNRLIK